MVEEPRTSREPRIAVFSLRKALPEISRCCAFEFEDVILDVDDAELITPVFSPDTFQSSVMKRMSFAVERRTPLMIAPKPAPVPLTLERDYEVLFFICQRLRDLQTLDALTNWRARCRQVVCWVEELWVDTLKWKKVAEPVEMFDHAFVGCRGSVEPLEALTGVPCTYGLPAVDVARFSPYPNPPGRYIDCYWMGRRAEKSHAALYRRAQSGNFHYLYDTVRSQKQLYDPAQHRTLLASLIKRSRYFVANKAKHDSPEQTAGQEEVGLRFFEGVGGGAVLLGAKPNCETWDKHFDWPDACIDMDWNSEAFPEVIDELDRDPDRVAAIHHRNAVQALRRHDWSYRWRDVLQTLGLEPSEKLAEREARLHAIADEAESAHG